jgi:hypothetical protein
LARHPFPGYIAFLDDAARQIGRPGAAAPARRIGTLAALANLCAQAAEADEADVPGILARAREFRDQLRAAYLAADMMLTDAESWSRDSPDPP